MLVLDKPEGKVICISDWFRPGRDGNEYDAFSVVSRCRRALRESGNDWLIPKYMWQIRRLKDFDELVTVSMRYMDDATELMK